MIKPLTAEAVWEQQQKTGRKVPLFSRLEPRTPFTGGRVTETDLLTLSEAARMATLHAGETVTVGDILRAAARGEILLCAIVQRAAKTQPCRAGDFLINGGEPVPKGAIPTLPLIACEHLARVGRASWRTFDGFEEMEQIGGEVCRLNRWQLTDDEPDFETVPDDCRVTGYTIHALADAFKPTNDTKPQAAQTLPANTEPEPVVEVPEDEPRRRYQMCIDAGLEMPDNDYAKLPAGINLLAEKEGISKQAFSKSVKKHLATLSK